MAELKLNNRSGKLGVALPASTPGAVETYAHLFAADPNLPLIVAPDFMKMPVGWLTDSEGVANGNYEIPYLTAYDPASPLAGTVTRAAEDAANWPAVEHALDDPWGNNPTAADFAQPPGSSAVSAFLTAATGNKDISGATSAPVVIISVPVPAGTWVPTLTVDAQWSGSAAIMPHGDTDPTHSVASFDTSGNTAGQSATGEEFTIDAETTYDLIVDARGGGFVGSNAFYRTQGASFDPTQPGGGYINATGMVFKPSVGPQGPPGSPVTPIFIALEADQPCPANEVTVVLSQILDPGEYIPSANVLSNGAGTAFAIIPVGGDPSTEAVAAQGTFNCSSAGVSQTPTPISLSGGSFTVTMRTEYDLICANGFASAGDDTAFAANQAGAGVTIPGVTNMSFLKIN